MSINIPPQKQISGYAPDVLQSIEQLTGCSRWWTDKKAKLHYLVDGGVSTLDHWIHPVDTERIVVDDSGNFSRVHRTRGSLEDDPVLHQNRRDVFDVVRASSS